MQLFSSKEKNVSIQTETIVKAIALAVVAFLLVKFVDNTAHQLRLIGIAFFLAVALNPAVNGIARHLKSGNRVLATGAAYLVVLSILFGLLSLVVPPIVHQVGSFIQDAPSTLDNFLEDDTLASQAVEYLRLENQLETLVDDLSSRAGDLSGPLFNMIGRIGGTLISIITVLVLAFMMLVEGPLWKKRILALQPPEKRNKRTRVMEKMYHVIIGYVNGQVIVAAIGAFFTLIALLVGNVIFAGSVNAVALAGVIFMFALIPLVGTTIGAVLIVLATLLVSLPYAIFIAIFFIIYQQIENATLQPIIQSKANHLTPLTVLVAALIGIGLGGLIGALAAIPIAGCIKVLFEEYHETSMPSMDSLKKADKD